MSDKVVPINSVLYELLVVHDMNNFTALNLRDRFIELSDELSADEARQYIYRHLARFQQLNFINKASSTDGQKPIFSRTAHFSKVNWGLHTTLSAPKRNLNEPSKISSLALKSQRHIQHWPNSIPN
ncbi:hypothetical protein [Photobacterium kasasachensis]|uniref:hypothetical protein n=1 Tax=Photobacterium kasasachensis TaxID=2910240 RepID=UPI003D10D3F6